MERKAKSPPYKMKSPLKTKLGRFLMGRTKVTQDDGTEVIINKGGDIVKTKEDGVTTKFAKGTREQYSF